MGARKIVRVVVDTNVLISALLFGGTPGRLLPLWKSGKILPYACKEIVDEYVRVLAYPKFDLGKDDIAYLLYAEILPYFDIISIGSALPIIIEDPSDDKFLHCASGAKADAIITGDKHLLAITSYNQIPIVTVDRFFSQVYSLNRFSE